VTLKIGERSTRHQALNLSASGVFVETETRPAQPGVQVTLELPDGKHRGSAGIVLHRLLPDGAAGGAGVQFTEADDAFRARLDAYLEACEALRQRVRGSSIAPEPLGRPVLQHLSAGLGIHHGAQREQIALLRPPFAEVREPPEREPGPGHTRGFRLRDWARSGCACLAVSWW